MTNRLRVAYPARLVHQDEGGYFVEFPDLEGCITEGDTVDDAKAMAREALTGWLESELAHGHDIPEPTVRGSGLVMIEPDPHVAIPIMLRQARKQAGLSQSEMAKRMGIAYTSYQHLEYPKNFNATVKNIERVGKALGMQVRIELVG